MQDEGSLRKEMAYYARLLYERGLTFSVGGNMSARIDGGWILITPSGKRKGELDPNDMIRVSIERGRAEGGIRPSIETPLHLAVYKRWGDAGAVIHAHPPCCTALALANVPLNTRLIPEAVIVLGKVPMIPYRTPGTELLAEALSSSEEAYGYLMEKHGAIAWGRDLNEAFNRMEEMEFLAGVQIRGSSLAPLEELPESEVRRLREMG